MNDISGLELDLFHSCLLYTSVQVEMQPQQERKEPQPIQDEYQEPKIIPHLSLIHI